MAELAFDITQQPDLTTCGPTCLHAVYRNFGDMIDLQQVIAEVSTLEAGGTLGALLAVHALGRGYRASLFSYNLELFDPTWRGLPSRELQDRLKQQLEHKPGRPRLERATRAYLDFLELGGEIRSADLSPRLLRRLLDDGHPLLTGLSATWLYGEAREIGATDTPDDLAGEPAGHFVVITGLDDRSGHAHIADPLQPNALAENGLYTVPLPRLITAILLGVLTYDANLLQLRPGSGRAPEPGRRE